MGANAFDYRGVNIEERIDIHTQTQRKAHSANPYMTNKERDEEMEHESVHETMEDEEEMEYNKDLVDTEWKTQSLPSLGRVSSEQTLESSGDEFAALRRTAPTRMLKSRNVSLFSNAGKTCMTSSVKAISSLHAKEFFNDHQKA